MTEVDVGGPATVVLRDNALAGVLVQDGAMPLIDLIHQGRHVRVCADLDGAVMLRQAAEMVIACILTGARSGSVGLTANEPALPVDVGLRVRAVRKRRGLSMETFARRLDVSPDRLADMERGREGVTVLVLAQAAAGLEITLAELFDGRNFIRNGRGLLAHDMERIRL